MRFHVQEGRAEDWLRAVDTTLPSPEDISGSESLSPVASLEYDVGPRSVVVLAGRRPVGSP